MLLKPTLIRAGLGWRDRFGNSEADAAADLGRRHQPEEVMDVRRALLNALELWYPPSSFSCIGSWLLFPKQRRVEVADLAMLPGPPGFLNGPWVQVQGGCISGADIAAWPYSVSLLCKFSVSMSLGPLVGCWIRAQFPSLCIWLKMEI